MVERKQYLISVRAGLSAVPDMAERLTEVEGVTVLVASAYRARVEATAEGITRIRSVLGDRCLVEEVVSRRPL
jgi:hypothetical protein